MAKGWESKAVEEQVAERENAGASIHAARAANADRERIVQSLQLQRERILSERTASAHRRSALAAALGELDERLAALGVAPAEE